MDIYEDAEVAKIKIVDKIIQIEFEQNTVLTLKLAKALVKQRLEVSNQTDFRLYIDIRNVISIDEQTRRYLAGSEGTQNAIAAAIHVENPLSKFLANLFIKVDKPLKPIKLFTQKRKALIWLKKFNHNPFIEKL